MDQAALDKRRRLLVLTGVMLGLFFSSMNQTMSNTALPRIAASLGGLDLYSWVFTAAMLTSTIATPVVGKLGDIYGRKPFFLWGILLFLVGNALSGLSQNMTQLIITRGITGLAQGAIFANSFAIIGDLFSPVERGKWQGVNSAVFGVSSIIAPLLGGYLTDNLSWRWVFFVNIPIGLLTLAVISRYMPSLTRRAGVRVDYLGATAISAFLVPFLLAFVWAGDVYPWVSPQIIGLLTVAALAGGAFVLIESRAAEPILPLAIFKNSIFNVSAVAAFVSGLGMFGAMLFIPLYMQGVLGVSATSSGVVAIPMMMGFVIGSAVSGQVISRTGRYRWLGVGGLMVATLGFFLMFKMDTETSHLQVMVNLLITGLGIGTTMPLYTIAVQNSLPYRMLGVGTSAVQLFRSIGGTIGTGVMGSILASQLSRNIAAHVPAEALAALPPESAGALASPQSLLNAETTSRLQEALGPQLFSQFADGMRTALSFTLHPIFLIGAVAMAASIIVAVFLKEIPLRKTVQTPEELKTHVGGQASGEPALGPTKGREP